MNTAHRMALYETVLGILVSDGRDDARVTFSVLGRADEYVQFKLHDGCVYGEVGSRQWHAPERPLPAAAIAGLAALGFTGGGPERNFAKDGLPPAPAELARLTDELLRVAYELDEDFSPIVHELHLNDVTPPRVQPFSRAMIEAHLRAEAVSFLRDQDGDFRIDLAIDGLPAPLVIWLVAEGPDEGIYRISTCVPSELCADHALERCNAWNRAHRWPTAFVGEDGAQIRLIASLDATKGVTQAMVDVVTTNVVGGMIEFCTEAVQEDASAF